VDNEAPTIGLFHGFGNNRTELLHLNSLVPEINFVFYQLPYDGDPSVEWFNPELLAARYVGNTRPPTAFGAVSAGSILAAQLAHYFSKPVVLFDPYHNNASPALRAALLRMLSSPPSIIPADNLRNLLNTVFNYRESSFDDKDLIDLYKHLNGIVFIGNSVSADSMPSIVDYQAFLSIDSELRIFRLDSLGHDLLSPSKLYKLPGYPALLRKTLKELVNGN
jgi:hypothetical protein